MNPTTSVIVAAVALLGSLFSALMSYRAASQANATAARKVDAEAFDRASQLYDKALAAAERETERLRNSVDRINAQLAQEQDVSNVLRNQVRALQSQVDVLEHTVASLRTALKERSQRGGHQIPREA